MKTKTNIIIVSVLALTIAAPTAMAGETSISGEIKAVEKAKEDYDKLDKQITDPKNQPAKEAKDAADANDQAQKYQADQAANLAKADKAVQDAVGQGKAAIKKADDDKAKAVTDKADADKLAKDPQALAKKATTGVKNGQTYMNLLEERRKAREAVRKAIDKLNAILGNSKITLVAGQHDTAQTVIAGAQPAISPVAKPEPKKEPKKEAKPGKTGAMLPRPESGTALAALTNAGKLTCLITATGETNGHIADAQLVNQTDKPLTFQLGPFVLVSKSRKGQDYGDTAAETVDLKPHETITVSVQGFCFEWERPPVGKGVARELVPEDGEGNIINPSGTVEKQGEPFNPPYSGQDVQTLLGRLQLIQQAAEIVDKKSDHKGNPYNRDMRILTDIQGGANCDDTIARITGGKPETEEDFDKRILKKARVANKDKDLTEEQSKDIKRGSKSLWNEIKATKKEVGELESTEGENNPPPSTANVSDEREGVPGARGTPPQTQTAPGQPAGSPPEQKPNSAPKEESKPKEEPKTTIEKKNDGSTIAKFPNGDSIEDDGKWHTTTKLKQGYTVEESETSLFITLPSGSEIYRDSEGKYTVTIPGQKPEVFQIPKSKSAVSEHDIGPIHLKLPGGATYGVFTLSDGTAITIFDTNSKEGPNVSIIWPNGDSTKISSNASTYLNGSDHSIDEIVKKKNEKGETVSETETHEHSYGATTTDSFKYSPSGEKKLEKSVETHPTIVSSDEPFQSIVKDLFPKDEPKKKNPPKVAPQPQAVRPEE